MRVKLQWLVFAFTFVIVRRTVKSVIYKTYIRSIENCKEPDPPFEKNRIVDLNVMAYNKSGNFYFKGNITIKENIRGYFWKIKAGVEKAGTVKYTSSFKKLTCKSVIPKLMLIAANVKYNEKTCELSRGNYTFQKMDLNKLDPLAYYYPVKEPGDSTIYLGFYGNKGTAYCTLSRYVTKIN